MRLKEIVDDILRFFLRVCWWFRNADELNFYYASLSGDVRVVSARKKVAAKAFSDVEAGIRRMRRFVKSRPT